MIKVAHTFGPPNHQNDALALLFMRQSHCIAAIKLLCQLTKAVQQHRGASVAFLSGEQAFYPRIQKLQHNVEKVLIVLKQHNSRDNASLQSEDLGHITSDWKTIRCGWQEDRILHNFEFHCHLVDTLKKTIRLSMKDHLLQHHYCGDSYRLLLDTLFSQMPDIIESLAMVRGLSTNAAVIKACGQDSHSRLSFLLKKIPNQNKVLVRSLDQLIPHYTTITSIQTIKNQQIDLHKFLLSIKMNILDSPEITENSTHLFDLSTQIIDLHWLAIDQGINVADKWVYERLIED